MKLSTKIALIVFGGATVSAFVVGFLVFSFTQSGFEKSFGDHYFISNASGTAHTIITTSAKDIAWNLIYILIPLFALGMSTLLFFIVVFVVNPLVKLTKTAKAIAAGDVTMRAPVRGRDEIGELTQSFNLMTERLVSLGEQTSALVKTLPEPLFFLNPQGLITSMNPAAAELVGYTAEELIGKSFKDVLAIGTLLKEARGLLAQALEKGVMTAKPLRFEEIAIKNRFYDVFIAPVKDPKGDLYGGVVVLHDITHIKEVDRLKNEFVSVASHQLRTPLTIIDWYLEMLLSGDAGHISARQKDYIEEVYGASRRMVRLVNDLLNVSRLDSGKLKIEPSPTQLEAFLQKIVNEIKPLSRERRCTLIFQKPKGKLPKVQIDQSLLQQIMQNLVINALRYSSPHICGAWVKLEMNQGGDYQISVRDSGIGIPKEIQPRIFQKFFRADNAVKAATEGTGLGLYIAKMAVEAFGGRIWFISEENKGTTFYFTIPAHGMRPKEGELGLSG